MEKILVVTLMLFALLCSLTEARRRVCRTRPAPEKCQITVYGPIPEPLCEMVSEDGQEPTEVCTDVGSAGLTSVMDSSFSSFLGNMGLSEVDYTEGGDGCLDCSLTL